MELPKLIQRLRCPICIVGFLLFYKKVLPGHLFIFVTYTEGYETENAYELNKVKKNI